MPLDFEGNTIPSKSKAINIIDVIDISQEDQQEDGASNEQNEKVNLALVKKEPQGPSAGEILESLKVLDDMYKKLQENLIKAIEKNTEN